MDEHRTHLIKAGETASRDYDRAVMTLAAGALGVSIAFVHDLAPHPRHIYWLGFAWLLFGLSLLSTLVSILLSQFALRAAIDEYDSSTPSKVPGGLFSRLTKYANVASAVTFVVGVFMLVVFAFLNLPRR